MASLTFALVVVSAVALASATTRSLGMLGVTLLAALHPISTTVLLLIAVGAHLYIKWRDR